MFWTHWNLSALRSFYDLTASGSQREYRWNDFHTAKFLIRVQLRRLFVCGDWDEFGFLTEDLGHLRSDCVLKIRPETPEAIEETYFSLRRLDSSVGVSTFTTT
jgi:hypothetical protein